jgi:hypothetical protein
VIPIASTALTLPVDPESADFDPPHATNPRESSAATDFMIPLIAAHGKSCELAEHKICSLGFNVR